MYLLKKRSTVKKSVILVIIIATLWGCDKDTFEIKGEPVNLIPNDDPSIFSKSVILFNDNNYLIKTPLDTFILGHPFHNIYGYYNDLKTRAINDAALKDTLYVYDYMPSKGDTIYTLAYHLERGSCFMWDKNARTIIKTIYVEYYAVGVPLASRAGRKFYIRDKIFLTTVDLISK